MHSRSRSDRFRSLVSVLALVGTVHLAGCARAVLPSEKAYLADPIMQFDEDDLEAAGDAHVAQNREGASGATGTAGGGCGCN